MEYKAFKEKMERYFLNGYQHAYGQGQITSIRYKIMEHTKSPSKYFPLMRKMMPLFNVTVIRNEHAIQEGIYIIGRTLLVSKFEGVIKEIIHDTEEKTNSWADKSKVTEIHGHSKKSNYKGRIISKFELIFEGIKKDYDHYASIRQILEHEKMDQVSFIEYIKGYSHLRNKTPLRWEES